MRYVLGPTFGYKAAAPAPVSEPAALPDPAVSVKGTDEAAGTVTLTVPAFDAAMNRVVEVRVYLAPSGSTPPADVNGYLLGTLPYGRADLASAPDTAYDVAVEVPALDPGDYFGQVVIGLDR